MLKSQQALTDRRTDRQAVPESLSQTVIDSHTVLLLLEEKPIEMLRTINITSDIDVDVARLGPAASSRASLLQLLLIPVFIFGCRTNVQ